MGDEEASYGGSVEADSGVPFCRGGLNKEWRVNGANQGIEIELEFVYIGGAIGGTAH